MEKSCENCRYENRGELEDPCVRCVHNATEMFKSKSNIDMIRSMSVLKLAEWLDEFCVCPMDDICPYVDSPDHKPLPCKECIAEWLEKDCVE